MTSQEIMLELEKPGTTLGDLCQFFADPKDAFTHSPVHISVRELSIAYGPKSVSEDEKDKSDFYRELMRRYKDERWMELRAFVQATRIATRKEAILEAEGAVWAMMTLDFHARRMRSSMARHEMLTVAVQERLELISSGERAFSVDVKDMCRELRDLEKDISEYLPLLGIGDRARTSWENKSGTRAETLQRIESSLNTIASARGVSTVFELVQNEEGESQGAEPSAQPTNPIVDKPQGDES